MKLMSKKIKHIVIHCSATRPDQDINAAEIRRWHTDPKPQGDGFRYLGRYYESVTDLPVHVQPRNRRGRGWDDIGYHLVIKRDGIIEVGRPLNVQGAHVRGHNAESIGICMVGGYDKNSLPSPDFTAEQFDSVVYAVAFLERMYPDAEVVGHRDLTTLKECPCFDVRDFFSGVDMGYSI